MIFMLPYGAGGLPSAPFVLGVSSGTLLFDGDFTLCGVNINQGLALRATELGLLGDPADTLDASVLVSLQGARPTILLFKIKKGAHRAPFFILKS
jgi:hypothetical protein